MDEVNSIEVRNITKKYKVYYDKGNSLKEKVLFKNRNSYELRYVLKGISFDVKKGEAVGIIGKNGCGKSTTLKLLTKILYPDSGTIEIKGRVSSLIELGAGFHPDMSGRENIYTNASIFGLTKKEIDVRLDDIIAFSELEDFVDNPVRTYSSGMYMRLAFAIAVNVDADVLLIDEILAVGDISFQKKCFDKIKQIKQNGTTIVLVSHTLSQIEEICERSIWLQDGEIKETGEPKIVHEHYQNSMEEKRLERLRIENSDNLKNNSVAEFCNSLSIRNGNRVIEFTNVHLEDKNGNRAVEFNTGDDITIRIKYKSKMQGLSGNFSFGISRTDGVCCFSTNIANENGELVKTKLTGEINIKLSNLRLLTGKYLLNVAVIAEDGTVYDEIQRVLFFNMISRNEQIGVYELDNKWKAL
jgi:ABC-type polysaccharide/polyol phosphate transport system ATPase subunit